MAICSRHPKDRGKRERDEEVSSTCCLFPPLRGNSNPLFPSILNSLPSSPSLPLIHSVHFTSPALFVKSNRKSITHDVSYLVFFGPVIFILEGKRKLEVTRTLCVAYGFLTDGDSTAVTDRSFWPPIESTTPSLSLSIAHLPHSRPPSPSPLYLAHSNSVFFWKRHIISILNHPEIDSHLV